MNDYTIASVQRALRILKLFLPDNQPMTLKQIADAVSYTHLDVYKRQQKHRSGAGFAAGAAVFRRVYPTGAEADALRAARPSPHRR